MAYHPEEPPARDYFFQYSWIIPGIFDPKVNLREHRYFGCSHKSDARFLFDFWGNIRHGNGTALQRNLQPGVFSNIEVKAPTAYARVKKLYDIGQGLACRATLSAKHDLALAALDMESDLKEVALTSGIEELKRRLEVLLGANPHAAVDETEKQRQEQRGGAPRAARVWPRPAASSLRRRSPYSAR